MSTFDAAVDGMVEVADLRADDYAWSAVLVWTDGKQFYWAEDQGCSCTYFGEELGSDDLKVLDSPESPTFREAVNTVHEVTEHDRQEFIATVRKAMKGCR